MEYWMKQYKLRCYGDSFTRYTGPKELEWPDRLGYHLGIPVENRGRSSISNLSIGLNVLVDYRQGLIDSNTIVLYMTTAIERLPLIVTDPYNQSGFSSTSAELNSGYRHFASWMKENLELVHPRVQDGYTAHGLRLVNRIQRQTQCQLFYIVGWKDIDKLLYPETTQLLGTHSALIRQSGSTLDSLATEITGSDETLGRSDSEYYIPQDGHWQPKMHELVALHLRDPIRRSIR